MFIMGVKNLIIILGLLHASSALWSCTSDLECSSLQGSVCRDGDCACPEGTESLAGGTWCGPIAPYYRSECREDFQCSRLVTAYECRHTENEPGECYCQPGHHYFRGRCWPSTDYHEPCIRDDECQGIFTDPFSMSCKSGVCDCADGYYLRQKGNCRKIASEIGEGCIINEDCHFLHGACNTNTFMCYDSTEPIDATEPKTNPNLFKTSNGVEEDNIRLGRKVNTNFEEDDTSLDIGVYCEVNNSCEDPLVCVKGVCVCPSGYYTVGNSTVCYADLGSPSAEYQCIGLLAVVSNGICTCPNNFYYSENMRDCVKATRVPTDSCVSDENCLTFGAPSFCGAAGQWEMRSCECDPEVSVWDEERMLCRYFSALGESCESSTDCYAGDVAAVCVLQETGGVCSCPEDYYESHGECLTTGLVLGESCRATSECNSTEHATCADGACACSEGFQQMHDACVAVIGGTCSVDSDCVTDNTVCVTSAVNVNSCQCVDGFVEYDEECWPVINSTDASCQNSEQCTHLLGPDSSCQDDRCQCAGGYHERDGWCWRMTGVFEPCVRSSQCYLNTDSDHLVCRNGFCQCDFDHPYSEELGTCTNAANVLRFSLLGILVSVIYLLL